MRKYLALLSLDQIVAVKCNLSGEYEGQYFITAKDDIKYSISQEEFNRIERMFVIQETGNQVTRTRPHRMIDTD